jgi:hypothetical protein
MQQVGLAKRRPGAPNADVPVEGHTQELIELTSRWAGGSDRVCLPGSLTSRALAISLLTSMDASESRPAWSSGTSGSTCSAPLWFRV